MKLRYVQFTLFFRATVSSTVSTYLQAKYIQINRIRITVTKFVKLARVSDCPLSICGLLLMIKLLQRGYNVLLKALPL